MKKGIIILSLDGKQCLLVLSESGEYRTPDFESFKWLNPVEKHHQKIINGNVECYVIKVSDEQKDQISRVSGSIIWIEFDKIKLTNNLFDQIKI